MTRLTSPTAVSRTVHARSTLLLNCGMSLAAPLTASQVYSSVYSTERKAEPSLRAMRRRRRAMRLFLEEVYARRRGAARQ